MNVLTSRIGKRKQNASILCVVRLFIKISTVVVFSTKITQIISESKQKKLQYRKFGITGLKSSLKATEKYAYCLGYLHFTSIFEACMDAGVIFLMSYPWIQFETG